MSCKIWGAGGTHSNYVLIGWDGAADMKQNKKTSGCLMSQSSLSLSAHSLSAGSPSAVLPSAGSPSTGSPSAGSPTAVFSSCS
jgi:hypothetical protein